MPPPLANLAAFSLQVLAVTTIAAIAMALPRIGTPVARYSFWRVTLALCLALPLLQTAESAGVDVPFSSEAAAGVTIETAVVDSPAAMAFDPTAGLLAIALLGITLRLVWVGVGLVRLRALRRAGEPMSGAECEDLQARLGVRADIRYAAAVKQPVTFGVRSPVVLLPDALREYPTATREAVLAHELLHVRRRDWCWVLVEEVVRAFLWFHPAFWWLVSRVQLAREEVVDACAVAVTGRRREYVRALLAFADDVPLAPASAFSRRRHLFRRIVQISREDVMSRRRLVVSVVLMVVAVAAGGWAATYAFPFQAQTSGVFRSEPGPLENVASPITSENPVPPRVETGPAIFPDEAIGEPVAAIVTLRTVVDQTGVVAEARLAGFAFHQGGFSASMAPGNTLANFEAFLQKATFRNSDGVTVSASSLRPMLQAFVESAATAVLQSRYAPPGNGPIVFDTIVQFITGRAVTMRTTAVPRPISTDGAIRVSGAVKPPRKVKDMRPVYPQEAQDAGVQGVVIAEVRVEPDGRVGAARIVRSVPMLDQAALDAIQQWEFQPTLLNGAPVPVLMNVTVQFTLSK